MTGASEASLGVRTRIDCRDAAPKNRSQIQAETAVASTPALSGGWVRAKPILGNQRPSGGQGVPQLTWKHALLGIFPPWHTATMLIDWTSDFSTWLDSVEEAGGPPLEWAIALLADLQDLAEPPTQETPTLKRVSRHDVTRCGAWRTPMTATLPSASSSGSLTKATLLSR